MRMRSLIVYVISYYGVYKCVCFCTTMSWCSVKASAAFLLYLQVFDDSLSRLHSLAHLMDDAIFKCIM